MKRVDQDRHNLVIHTLNWPQAEIMLMYPQSSKKALAVLRHQIFPLTSLSPTLQLRLCWVIPWDTQWCEGGAGWWRTQPAAANAKPCPASLQKGTGETEYVGVVSRGNCESYSQALPVQSIFICLSTLKQVIYYFMYVQCSQTQKDLKTSPERAKPAWSWRQQQWNLAQKMHQSVFKASPRQWSPGQGAQASSTQTPSAVAKREPEEPPQRDLWG